jgi:hypothetical protein
VISARLKTERGRITDVRADEEVRVLANLPRVILH